MKNLTSVLGRTLFALPFAIFGFFHLMAGSKMSGMVPSFVPFQTFWVYFTGVALLLGAICIIIKKYAQLAAFGLVLFLALTSLLILLPGLSNPDPQMSQMAMTGFLKDIGLAGAALFMSGYLKS